MQAQAKASTNKQETQQPTSIFELILSACLSSLTGNSISSALANAAAKSITNESIQAENISPINNINNILG